MFDLLKFFLLKYVQLHILLTTFFSSGLPQSIVVSSDQHTQYKANYTLHSNVIYIKLVYIPAPATPAVAHPQPMKRAA